MGLRLKLGAVKKMGALTATIVMCVVFKMTEMVVYMIEVVQNMTRQREVRIEKRKRKNYK